MRQGLISFCLINDLSRFHFIKTTRFSGLLCLPFVGQQCIDILVQKHRNKLAAQRFFRKLLKGQQKVPRRMITDKLKSYSAALREVMPSVSHSTEQYENNRAEVSHEPTRLRERQMRRFKSAGQAQRFLTVHGAVGNLFRLGRHLTRAIHYREFRSRAFCEWQKVTCAQILA